MSDIILKLTVHSIINDGTDVILLDLRDPNNAELPAFSAGAHIDIHTSNGLIRQYSLCNDSRERHRYLVAIALANPSRGGSQWIHEQLKQGDLVSIGAPRNHFELNPSATHSVLVAGGIGITPMLAMAMELDAQGKPWEIHFSARTKIDAALLATVNEFMTTAKHGALNLYLTREQDGQRINFSELYSKATSSTHYYCCGSNEFLNAYIEAGKVLPTEQVHFERFSSDQEAANDNEFTLILAKSGKELPVERGQTVLDVLKANHVSVKYMCSEGVCGSCEIRILEGEADHRDSVLSDAEKAANKSMMVCCSGAKSQRLVLDL